MRKVQAEVTILRPQDMRKAAREVDISEVTQMDVRNSFNVVREAEILLYINSKGQGKVLKNRY